MTRLSRYQLFACPTCNTIYKHPLWGSVSVYVPRSTNPKLMRVCTKCGFQAPLDGWNEQGTVETCTPDEKERRNEALMYSLGMGPKPTPELKTFFQRMRAFWLGAPKPIDQSAQYPQIKIAD